eukprot:gene8672-14691_t
MASDCIVADRDLHEDRLLDEIIAGKTDLHVDKRDPSKRPVIFTASSVLPTPISGYKSFREQVGGHLSVQDSPYPQKVERELIRYKYQAQLGFRVTGFKLFKAKTNETELFDRFYCKGIQPQDITRTFSYFFDIQSFPERRYLVKEVINKLKQLLQWFEKQKRIKFFRTSLLIAYDGSQKITEKKAWQKQEHFATDANGSKSFELGEIYQIEKKANANFHFQNVGIHDFPPASLLGSHRKSNLEMGEECIGREKCVVKMIDFAHTFCDLEEMSDCIDENYIYGLKSLINEIEKCLGNGF